MNVVKFINKRNEIIESKSVNENSVYDLNIFPEEAVGFIHYNDDEILSSYVIGKQLTNLNVVKIVNDELYKQFIEYSKINDGTKYLIGVLNSQVYFLCVSSETTIVSNFKELQECLYQILYEMTLKIRKK